MTNLFNSQNQGSRAKRKVPNSQNQGSSSEKKVLNSENQGSSSGRVVKKIIYPVATI